MGLVKQVLESLYKRNIQRLTKTFLTLSLVDVANRAKLDRVEQAESYIVDMVMIHFSVDGCADMLATSPNFMIQFCRLKAIKYLQQSTSKMEWSCSMTTRKNTIILKSSKILNDK